MKSIRNDYYYFNYARLELVFHNSNFINVKQKGTRRLFPIMGKKEIKKERREKKISVLWVKEKLRREKRTVKIESFDNSTLLPRKPDPPKLIKKCKIRVRSPTNRRCISVFFFFFFLIYAHRYRVVVAAIFIGRFI